jgi:hypothetical protein
MTELREALMVVPRGCPDSDPSDQVDPNVRTLFCPWPAPTFAKYQKGHSQPPRQDRFSTRMFSKMQVMANDRGTIQFQRTIQWNECLLTGVKGSFPVKTARTFSMANLSNP